MIPRYRIEEFRTHPVEIELQNLGMLKIFLALKNLYQKGNEEKFIIEIEMNEQEYAFGAKFNYDMYNYHQDGWKAGSL